MAKTQRDTAGATAGVYLQLFGIIVLFVKTIGLKCNIPI